MGVDRVYAYLTEAEAFFLDAAVVRLIPADEIGPGAKEAGVTSTYRDVHGLPLVRMTFDWRDNGRASLAHIIRKALDTAAVIGPSKLGACSILGKYDIVPYQSTHNAGGVTMAADPDSSAVNKYLQSRDVDDVFVVGASVFPHYSAHNPSETVGVPAFWTADAIRDRHLKRPVKLA
ncbi:Gluconate 2-dehydrogenase (EC 1.1.99.3), membrane-bound, flavoprotein [Azospirillum endophyticum]